MSDNEHLSPYFDVLEFHEKFGLDINERDEPFRRARHFDIIREEASEVMDALYENEPLEQVAKELADLVYTAYDAAIALGINLDDALHRVHLSNMTKLVDGKPVLRADGKVLKPNSYVAPDMTGVVY